MPREWPQIEECTNYCRCGATFRAKHRIDYETKTSEVDRPCPACGSRFSVWRASYDPETIVLK